jgi:hypothetical protein
MIITASEWSSVAAALLSDQDGIHQAATGCGTARLVTGGLIVVGIPLAALFGVAFCAAFSEVYRDLRRYLKNRKA